MKTIIQLSEIETLIAPYVDKTVKLEYLGLNNLRVKYGNISIRISLIKVEGYVLSIKYELDIFQSFVLKTANLFFDVKGKVNPNIFNWDISKKVVVVNLLQIPELAEFRRVFRVENILTNAFGITINLEVLPQLKHKDVEVTEQV